MSLLYKDSEGNYSNIAGSSASVKDVYSTSETLTNKVWTDGKPIYRNVIIDNAITKGTQKNIDLSALNIGSYVSINGYIDTGHYQIPINTYRSDVCTMVLGYNQQGELIVFVDGSLVTSTSTLVAIIEYTKSS